VCASVRRYEGNAGLADELSSRADEVRTVVGGIPGFRAYYLLAAGGDTISISVFDDEAGAQQSNEAAAAWLSENVPNLPAAPAVSAGEVLLSF